MDVVKALSSPPRGERQSAASQPEKDGPRAVLPAEVARQWAAQQARPVVDFVLAPPVEELPELAPMALAQVERLAGGEHVIGKVRGRLDPAR